MIFDKPKKKFIEVDGKQVELEPKPKSLNLSSMFKSKPKQPEAPKPTLPASQIKTPTPTTPPVQQPTYQPRPTPPPQAPISQPYAASTKPVVPAAPKPQSFNLSGMFKSKPKQVPPPKPVTAPPLFKMPTRPQTPITPPKTFISPQPIKKPVEQPYVPTPEYAPKPAGPLSSYSSMASMNPTPGSKMEVPKKGAKPVQTPGGRQGKGGAFKHLIEGIGSKHKNLEANLRKSGMKVSVYQFVKNMLIASIVLTIVVAAVLMVVLSDVLTSESPVAAIMLSLLIAVAVFVFAFQTFLNFPSRKEKASSKNIERDILFAARDMIISLRSGMPLFNAITSISTGYGDSSKEFLKVVEKVQLGTPLDEAIDETVEETKSPSFRKIMLQASVSIKVGADVTSALQSVIDQLSQERVIELRRYGQRLNAIAMFYMLFGIIIPSMGIAVLTILTTFIAIFQVTFTLLEAAIVGIIFLQIIFLQMIRSSRPAFTL